MTIARNWTSVTSYYHPPFKSVMNSSSRTISSITKEGVVSFSNYTVCSSKGSKEEVAKNLVARADFHEGVSRRDTWFLAFHPIELGKRSAFNLFFFHPVKVFPSTYEEMSSQRCLRRGEKSAFSKADSGQSFSNALQIKILFLSTRSSSLREISLEHLSRIKLSAIHSQ